LWRAVIREDFVTLNLHVGIGAGIGRNPGKSSAAEPKERRGTARRTDERDLHFVRVEILLCEPQGEALFRLGPASLEKKEGTPANAVLIGREVVDRDAIGLVGEGGRRWDPGKALNGDEILDTAEGLGKLRIMLAGARFLEIAIDIEPDHAGFEAGDPGEQSGEFGVIEGVAVFAEIPLGHSADDDVVIAGGMKLGPVADEGVVNDDFRSLEQAARPAHGAQAKEDAEDEKTGHRAAGRWVPERLEKGFHSQLPIMR
jgi:hypothetical protein